MVHYELHSRPYSFKRRLAVWTRWSGRRGRRGRGRRGRRGCLWKTKSIQYTLHAGFKGPKNQLLIHYIFRLCSVYMFVVCLSVSLCLSVCLVACSSACIDCLEGNTESACRDRISRLF